MYSIPYNQPYYEAEWTKTSTFLTQRGPQTKQESRRADILNAERQAQTETFLNSLESIIKETMDRNNK